MTERQYKTLRKLLSLWIAVVVRRRYTIFQNSLLVASLIANFYFVFIRSTTSQPASMAASIISNGINLEQALDLSNYPSISNPNKNLMSRYTRIYKIYLDDKTNPDNVYFQKNGNIGPDWFRHCKSQLIKIINIKNRIKTVESLLLKTYPDKTDDIYLLSNKSEESLADMSNYYSKFLPTEVYDSIVKTYD